MTYAKETTVSSDRSRSEIEKTLARYGATRFLYAWEDQSAVIGFELHDRRIRFVLPLPRRESNAFTKTPTGRDRTVRQAQETYEQAVKQRWRALALAIKAKLESVECGIEQFDEAFLAHIVQPNGRTIGEEWLAELPNSLAQGNLPSLLPSG
jgi:uncharacterized protein (DUF2252 family)